MSGMMGADMKETGETNLCTGMVSIHVVMAECTSVNIKMIKNMVKVAIPGRMENNI